MTQRGELYNKALKSFEAGVNAADPFAAVQQNMPAFERHPLVVAVGKAAVRMARAASESLGGLQGAIVVTNPENAQDVAGANVFAAAHPVPDAIGLEAGRAVIHAVQTAPENQPILCLVSGGGSALLPAPVDGVSLADKAALNQALLASGADIVAMNMVRQQVSKLKGGGLLNIAGGRPLTALILSDVIGDDLRAIASGPTVAPIGTAEDAVDLCKSLGIWEDLPPPIKAHLLKVENQVMETGAKNHLIGSNEISLQAMHGVFSDAQVVKQPLVGNVTDAAAVVAGVGKGAFLFGGETTVTLTGSGKGGRNQDLALRVALLAEQAGWQEPWFYLQGGTDGRDGPTDAAGGVVDETTLSKIRARGLDPQTLLTNNDAYTALAAGDGLLMTGGTGTNVADLGVLIRR